MIDRIESCTSEPASTSAIFNGFALSTSVTPARDAARGGDWCETFVINNDIVALSIGDVFGHGTEHFAAMVVIRQAIRDAVLRDLNPARVLAVANRFVCDLSPELHATALLALLDTRRKSVTFANAGHPPPLIVGPTGSKYVANAIADLPLGIDTALLPALRVASTPARTLLVLYTDGVTEHDRDPIRGEAQLRDAAIFTYIHSAAPTASGIEKRMFVRGSNRDDASLLTAWIPRNSLRRRRTDAIR